MEQQVRLSKNQIRKARKQATQEKLKKQRQQQESSSSPEGKIMISPAEPVNPQIQSNDFLQDQIEKLKAIITKQDEMLLMESLTKKLQRMKEFTDKRREENMKSFKQTMDY